MVSDDWFAGHFDDSASFETPGRESGPMDNTAILVDRSSWALSSLALRLFSFAGILRRRVSRYPFASVRFILLCGRSLWDYHYRSGSQARSHPGTFIYILGMLAPRVGGSVACMGHHPVVSSLIRR
jgi:hypothetical protein